MKLSVIIPAYNEEHTIIPIVDKVLTAPLPENITKEIIIVDDHSIDKTPELLKKYDQNPDIKRYRHESNQGKTAALVTGFKKATGDLFLIQDADLEYSPDDYPKLLQPILDNKSSIVYGSRFKGKIKSMLWINRYSNILSNITFNLLYGTKLTDINTCFKVFRKELIQPDEIISDHFTFETEMTAKWTNRKHTIIEVPIDYEARTKKEGKKIGGMKALKMFWGIFRFRKTTR